MPFRGRMQAIVSGPLRVLESISVQWSAVKESHNLQKLAHCM
jgi:hypothetical protein